MKVRSGSGSSRSSIRRPRVSGLSTETESLSAEDAARRLLARLPERTGRTLERLAASLDKDLVVSSFSYIAQDFNGAAYPERAVLMARSSWASQNEPARLGIGLGQSVDPDPHDDMRRPFWGIYAADQEVLDRLRESCGPSDGALGPMGTVGVPEP